MTCTTLGLMLDDFLDHLHLRYLLHGVESEALTLVP